MRTQSKDNHYTSSKISIFFFLKALGILMLMVSLNACSKATGSENESLANTKDSVLVANKGEGGEEIPNEEQVTIPDSEIYLAPLQFSAGELALGAAINISNNPDYDNQPFFLTDNNTILFTSYRDEASDNKQSDIYAYYIDSGKTVQVTDTPESEYSPTRTPQGESVSTVRVEMDSTQRLWEFPLMREGGDPQDNTNFKVVFPEVKRVGYHAWTDADKAMLFLVDVNPEGDQHTLEKASRSSDGSQIIATKIGRSIAMRPEHKTISFIDKSDDDNWLINLYDLETNTVTQSLATLSGSEDLVWLNAEHILMAKDQGIYLKHVNDNNEDWQMVFAQATQSIEGEISRLAVSPDRKWLAFVVTQ